VLTTLGALTGVAGAAGKVSEWHSARRDQPPTVTETQKERLATMKTLAMRGGVHEVTDKND
jgi:hypothetical protein